jgi:hypothetical protein
MMTPLAQFHIRSWSQLMSELPLLALSDVAFALMMSVHWVKAYIAVASVAV